MVPEGFHKVSSLYRLCGAGLAYRCFLRGTCCSQKSQCEMRPYVTARVFRDAAMGKGCITVTKYFLFLFNLLFFIFGALIMGFGLWVLFDNQSFIAVLQESSDTVKVASYILIGVGSLSMAMGFFGCIGAIYEIRCLLGLYFTCLLLILIAQVTAGVLIYFQRDRLKYEMSNIIKGMIVNYTGQNRTTEHTWDYIQRT
ncbi:CD82 antigen, partial [Nibea albiflora]